MDAIVLIAHIASICYALNAIHNFGALSQGTWIIDFGGSKHMSSTQNSLHDWCPFDYPVLVNLPSGTTVKVTHQGKLQITLELELDHGLLVPHFNFNLLLIKRLCE